MDDGRERRAASMSVRADTKVSCQRRGRQFQFLWKRKLDSQPLLAAAAANIIAYKGFKALAFVGSASGSVYSVGYDLNRMFWERSF